MFENVELPLTYRGMRTRERKSRLMEVDMLHQAKHFPGQLSGGQQQRVAEASFLISLDTDRVRQR